MCSYSTTVSKGAYTETGIENWNWLRRQGNSHASSVLHPGCVEAVSLLSSVSADLMIWSKKKKTTMKNIPLCVWPIQSQQCNLLGISLGLNLHLDSKIQAGQEHVSWRSSNDTLPWEGTCASAAAKSHLDTISLTGFVISSGYTGCSGTAPHVLSESWNVCTPSPQYATLCKRPWVCDSHRVLEITVKSRSA